MIEFKRYPTKEGPENKFRVCICGHYWHKHKRVILGRDGNCVKCECPKYEEIGEFTHKECKELGVE